MPRSRKRTPRNRSIRQRRRARQQRANAGRRVVATLRPGESLEHLITPEDVEILQKALDAEVRGDATGAWQHHMSGLIVEESLTHHSLRELAVLGDDAPAWMCSRWAVDQSLRWMLVCEDPRCDEIVRLVLAGLHDDQLERLLDDLLALKEYGTLVAATDWVYQQLAAYEYGGLRDFLDVRAEGGLLERLDHIDEWERSAISSYELVGVRDDVIEVRRLSDDVTEELLNLGATTDIGPGAYVVGRVVPTSAWPFAMFESRPLPVDVETARAVGERMSSEGDFGWFWALAEAHGDGRLPSGATCRNTTLWSTDVIPDRGRSTGEPSPRMRDLMNAGLSEYVANCVTVVEVGLIVAEVSGDVGAIASHVTASMIDPRVHDALRHHGVEPGRGPLWRVLAAGTPSPVRERCLELAELSEQAAA
ncbi:hypothetical protein JI751_16740 [Nocardioides sp. G10]|uniref:Uncharacterized protein n=2 Tax=Nocardioides baculatus TaxID=2801337 RepID=A0ABS1LCC9_9ACTN|nr:hypothetical protein [Nocardioides baculatus]